MVRVRCGAAFKGFYRTAPHRTYDFPFDKNRAEPHRRILKRKKFAPHRTAPHRAAPDDSQKLKAAPHDTTPQDSAVNVKKNGKPHRGGSVLQRGKPCLKTEALLRGNILIRTKRWLLKQGYTCFLCGSWVHRGF